MSKHTKCQWVVREQENSFTIGQEFFGGKLIAETAPFFSYLGAPAKELARANARRIAACVNALEGLTTEQIEEGVFQKMREERDFLAAEVDALTKQRDELLAALEDLYNGYVFVLEAGIDSIMDLGGQCDPVDVMVIGDPILVIARAVIAKAKGAAK